MKTACVLVLYDFSLETVESLISSLSKQVEKIFLIDNSLRCSEEPFSQMSHVEYLWLGGNKGIAVAQNVGIRKSLDEGFDFLMFCDQDSKVPIGAVEKLADTFYDLSSINIKVGAVGTRAVNSDTGIPYSYGFSKIDRHKGSLYPLHVTEVTFVMNSISLFPVDFFRMVGLMDERLFIDGVDSEICWRARHDGGYRFFINENVQIGHCLGLGLKKICGHYISITPPNRIYYQYRNYLWLSRRKYVPRKWVIYNGIKYFIKLLYYPLVYSNRAFYLKNMIKGLHDGMAKY